MKRIVCLILVAVMLALALASCGKRKTDLAATTAVKATAAEATAGDSASATAEQTTAEETTANKWEIYGPEVSGYAEAARTFRIKLDSSVSSEKTSKNDVYLVGPDEVTEGVTPTIQQMVYQRNKNAEALLGVKPEYTYLDKGWGQQQSQIQTYVQGAAADAPDLFVNMIYDLGKATLNACFKDIWSIPGSYFDWDVKGWMKDWMETMSFTGDRAYVLAGDYFVDILRAFGVLPFNLAMMEANVEKLAPALLGEEIGNGEELAPRFFDLVEEGYWTWELLGKLCEAIWQDTDNDDQNSIADQLGIVADKYGGLTAALYIYSCGEELFETDKSTDPGNPHYDRQWIYYPAEFDALGGIFDAVAAVYNGKGALVTRGSSLDASTPEDPGVAYHRIMFASGQILTAGVCVLGALEDDSFQSMTDVYSVVPLPKVSSDKEYNTVIHNVGDAGAINVNTNPAKARALSAFLQYCTENSGEIRQEFLEIVTKYKTTTYNQGTDRMLDIIYASVINARDKAVEDTVGTDQRWHVIMKDGGSYKSTSATLASAYEGAKTAKQNALDTILTTWYGLPTVASDGD